MGHSHRAPRLRLVATACACLPLASAALGQEEVGFDLRETDTLTLDWKTLLGILLGGLVMGVLWKLLIWLLESRREAINWAKLRIWWPMGMVAWGLVMLPFLLLDRVDFGGRPLEAAFTVFFLLNLPEIAIAVVLFKLVWQCPPWLGIPLAGAAIWGGNYLLVRLAEWRASANVPTSLHLRDPK